MGIAWEFWTDSWTASHVCTVPSGHSGMHEDTKCPWNIWLSNEPVLLLANEQNNLQLISIEMTNSTKFQNSSFRTYKMTYTTSWNSEIIKWNMKGSSSLGSKPFTYFSFCINYMILRNSEENTTYPEICVLEVTSIVLHNIGTTNNSNNINVFTPKSDQLQFSL